MAFVTYAQNSEDLILYRALKNVTNGFYVDVGANDAIIDSATNAFYERGWRGINIEPVASWFASLQKHRPEDRNIQCVVTSEAKLVEFYEVEGSGLSTLDRQLAEKWSSVHGFALKPQFTPGFTLTQILDSCNITGDIHFLKVDVEGAEPEVIAGLDLERYRPWIIVMEATAPLSQTNCHLEWEQRVLSQGYRHVYSDGLNRYYLANERSELADAFAYPPNIFDEVVPHRLSLLYQKLFEINNEQEGTNSKALVVDHSRDRWDASTYFHQAESLIDSMKLQNAALMEKVQDLIADSENAELAVEALRQEQVDKLRQQQASIQALKDEIADAWRVAASFERELIAMRSTWTWIIASPLRKVERFIRKCFGKHENARQRPQIGVKQRLRNLERKFRHYRRGIVTTATSPATTVQRAMTPRAQEVLADIKSTIQNQKVAA